MHLPCFFLKGTRKQHSLDIYLTASYGVINFANTWAMKFMFFFNGLKLNLDFRTARKKSENIFDSEIILSELVALNCLY